jgi:acetyl esterase/lipase
MSRLIISIMLSLASLLTVFSAPAYYLWLLAILVSEFPLILLGFTIIILVSGFWIKPYRAMGTVIGALAFMLFLSPVVRAYSIAKHLQNEMTAALGISKAIQPPHIKPFSLTNMFKGVTVKPHKVFTYATYPNKVLKLDYYKSEALGKRPCVIVIHGGSWSSGNSEQLPELNSYLSAKGYQVAAINYRLAPENQTPAPVEDVQQALKFLRLHAERLQVDTNRFVLLGRSAGAQIALLAAYTLKDAGIKGVIDFYGPADMVWGYSVPSNPLVMDSRKVMENYIGGTYSQVPQKYADCSPLVYVGKQSVPTLIIHGANDVLVAYEHSRRLNIKLKQNGILHYWLQLPWATHGFDYHLNGPGGQLSTYAVETFLKAVVH